MVADRLNEPMFWLNGVIPDYIISAFLADLFG